MLWISCGQHGLAGCVSPGWGLMPATARSRRFCGRWTMTKRCSLPTCTARRGCGRKSRSSRCRADRRGRAGVRQGGGHRTVLSRSNSWRAAFVRRIGRALFCATARAVRCALMSPAGGSGCGMVRKPPRCWHLIARREVGSPKDQVQPEQRSGRDATVALGPDAGAALLARTRLRGCQGGVRYG
jgi:hypothetical protein